MNEKQGFILSFIFKPVTAWVINILIIIIGAVSFRQLSVRLYPVIENPVLSIETSYSDAGPDVIESQLTKPIEEQLMGITGLKNISSSSRASTSNVYMTFEPTANMIEAYNQVQTRVAKARSSISTGRVTLQESRISKSDPNSSAIFYMMLTGADLSLVELGDYAIRAIKPEMESISGIAALQIWGGGAGTGNSAYQMNINVEPNKLNNLDITYDELLQSIKSQIYKIPVGLINDGRFDRSVAIQSELNTIKDFATKLLVRRKKDFIPLGTVAQSIEIKTDDPNLKVRFGKRNEKNEFVKLPAVGIAVTAQARQSPVAINTEFQTKLPLIKKNLPKAANLSIIENVADIITTSINAVYRSLFEAILFVFIVILFFLQSPRASLVPMITIPICLISGFGIMYFCGFTINLLTLLAMVLATGLVVDDAIVVLENIYKYLEKGESRLNAAIKGTKEIQFSVIAMTLTLAAVYAPIALVPGLIGSLFSEFAFTLTGMVIISGITALVLSPMMCSRILLPPNHTSGLAGSINNIITKIEEKYKTSIIFTINHMKYAFAIVGALIAGAFLLFYYVLPSKLSPDVNSGRFQISFQAPTGIKMEELDKHVRKLEDQIEKIPEVESYYSQIDVTGSMSYIGVYLKPNARSVSKVLADHSKAIYDNTPIALSNLQVRPRNLQLGSSDTAKGFTLSIQSNKDYASLIRVGEELARTLVQEPGILPQSVMYDRTSKIKTYSFFPDRAKAAALGVDLYSLQGLGSIARGLQAGYFTKESKRSEIYLKSAKNLRMEDILKFSVRNNKQELVQLKELVKMQEVMQLPAIPRQAGMRSFTIFADLDPSYNIGTVYENFKAKADRILPEGYRMAPIGALEDYIKESGNTFYIIALSLLFIFLILAAQFESFIDPLIVVSTVPLSWIGAVVILALTSDGSFNIFSGIGFLTLVGLVTKHGILIVDFANQNLTQGQSISQAVINASISRFRPVVMTTAAMVLGALPLALAGGIGYEIRRQIGLVIVGGMSIGTLFTLLFVPCVYIVIKSLTTKNLTTKYN